MVMREDAIVDLEKLIRKARQQDLPFGLCLGKKPEDTVMLLSLKKTGEVLMRQARQEGETGKVTHGTASVQGKILSLTLEGKMIPGLAKSVKVFLAKIGMKMKVVILDADGTELEAEDDDEPDLGTADGSDETAQDQAAPKAGADGDTDPQARKWAALHAALGPRVAAFGASGAPKAAAIVKAWDGGIAAARAGDFGTALAVAAKIGPVVRAGAETAGTGPDAQRWTRVEGPLGALFAQVMKGNPPQAATLRTVWMAARDAAQSGDHARAVAMAGRLKPMLDAAQERQIPPDVMPFHKSKRAWEAARRKMHEELGKLVEAIEAACAGDAALQGISKNAAGLTGYLRDFDTRLDQALDDIIASPPGAGRAALRKQAIGIVEEYRAALAADFFRDVDDKNGFTNVKVTATAHASLAAISRVLAA